VTIVPLPAPPAEPLFRRVAGEAFKMSPDFVAKPLAVQPPDGRVHHVDVIIGKAALELGAQAVRLPVCPPHRSGLAKHWILFAEETLRTRVGRFSACAVSFRIDDEQRLARQCARPEPKLGDPGLEQ
jgi:hypothetical protein